MFRPHRYATKHKRWLKILPGSASQKLQGLEWLNARGETWSLW